jgi:hypothetical protein
VGLSAGNPISRRVRERLEEIAEGLRLGETATIFKEACAEYPDFCSLVPGPYFFPVGWEEAWMFIDPVEADLCRQRVEQAYCLHWWGSAIEHGVGLPLDQLPPAGSYLFSMAARYFGTDALPAVDAKAAEVWCRNFRSYVKLKELEATPQKLARRSTRELLGDIWHRVKKPA